MLLIHSLGHRQASSPKGFIQLWHPRTVSSRPSQGFIFRNMPLHSPFTNNCHSRLSYIILLDCPAVKSLFFKQSFTESFHLFRYWPTRQLPTHSPTYTLLAILSFSILSIWPYQRRKLSSILSSTPFATPYNYLERAFGTLSILDP